VSYIERIAVKIEEAQSLRSESIKEIEKICRSLLFRSINGRSTSTKMKQLVELNKPDIIVQPDEMYYFAGVYSFGRGVFVGDKKLGSDFAYTRLSKLRSNQFVYPKLMAWEGALGTVPPECDGLFVSPEFLVFDVDEDQILPEVLDVFFRTPSVWPQLSAGSTGTNVRRKRLNATEFLDFEIPLPPMLVQREIREIKKQLLPLQELQAMTDIELKRLFPAILEKVFNSKQQFEL
jgi:type I restriction enzyme, S subunit